MSKQPDAVFYRNPQTDRRTGAWLAGYLLMTSYSPPTEKRQAVAKPRDCQPHPSGRPEQIGAGGTYRAMG